MERRVMGNYHARCGAGEKPEVGTPEAYLSLFGQIPDFNEKLATMRKYEISCSIILQALSQLKELYKDSWNTIVSNCDTKLFLGCDDSETIEWMLKMLGKKTTTVMNESFQSGNGGGSMSINRSSLELLTIDQISMMQDTECLVRIRGVRPYYGKKYELTHHPNYKYAMDTAGTFYIPLSGTDAERDRRPLWERQKAQENASGEEQPDPSDIPGNAQEQTSTPPPDSESGSSPPPKSKKDGKKDGKKEEKKKEKVKKADQKNKAEEAKEAKNPREEDLDELADLEDCLGEEMNMATFSTTEEEEPARKEQEVIKETVDTVLEVEMLTDEELVCNMTE